MDNHRPFHLANIASEENVTCFVDDYELDEEVPEYDSDLENSDGESDEDSASMDDADDSDDSDEEVWEDEEKQTTSALDIIEEEGDEEGDEEDEDAGSIDAENEDEDDAASKGNANPEDINESDGESSKDDDSAAGSTIDVDGGEHSKADAVTTDMTEGEEGNTSNEGQVFDDDDDGDGERVFKRRRIDPGKEKRRRVASHYNQQATFAAPTALMMLKLVGGRTGSHVALDLIWQAILGVTDQHQRQRMAEEDYDGCCEMLHLQLADHLSSEKGKFTVGEGDLAVVVPGAQTGHIEEGRDFRFFLYRHWSLFEAMCFSPYVAAKLAVWQSHGTGRLQELLAKMGVPLEQCKQTYNFMAPAMKEHFRRQIISQVAKDYGFSNPDVTCRAFFRFNSFKNPVAASDIVSASSALVEVFKTVTETDDKVTEESRLQAFNEAYDCLGMKAEEMLQKGLHLSINLQKMIVRKASGILEDYLQITKLKNLYFAYASSSGVNDRAPEQQSSDAMSVSDENEIDAPFSRPMVLARLGQYIMDVKMSMSKRDRGWVGKRLLPFLLIGEERRNKVLIVGISPLQSTIGKSALGENEDDLRRVSTLCNFNNFFKLAASDLAKDAGTSFRTNTFDAHVIEIQTEEIDPRDFVYSVNLMLNAVSA
jgi:hypothetical protein